MKYSKAPWKYDGRFNHLRDAEGKLVKIPDDWRDEDEKRSNNAALIEEAPSMFETLKALIANAESNPTEDGNFLVTPYAITEAKDVLERLDNENL